MSSAVRAGAVATVVTAVARRVLGAVPPGGSARWTRTNHRSEPVSLLAGPALTVGLLAGACAAGGTHRETAGVLVAVAGASAFGLVDDLGEDTAVRTKGLRGHLGALGEGRVTTGAAKVLGIGASAFVAALLLGGTRGVRGRSVAGRVLDAGVDTVLIAGSANLLNLLDLRPGRALKAGGLGALTVCGVAPGLAGTVCGAAGALIGGDLAERDMLGDCGANALGAALGSAAVRAPLGMRLAAATMVTGLTVVSERVSFSAVIDRNPVLSAIDRWGRR